MQSLHFKMGDVWICYLKDVFFSFSSSDDDILQGLVMQSSVEIKCTRYIISWIFKRNFNWWTNACFVNRFRDRIISMKFMRKYIHVAKDMKPILTRAAADFIADEYSKLRNQDNLQQENIARVRLLCWYFACVQCITVFTQLYTTSVARFFNWQD